MSSQVRTKENAPSVLAGRLAAFDAATLHEAFDRKGALPSSIKPVDPAMVCCGPAYTVECLPGDNLMLQVAISYAPRGSVVVLAVAGDFSETGVFGDMLATAAHVKGLAGLVTNARVRDAKALRRLGFPVFSTGLCIQGAAKNSIGPLNVPIAIGGQLINPGDWIVGDEDGVVAIPLAACERVLAAAGKRVELEQQKVASYQAGHSVIDVNKLGALLEQKGWSIPF